MPPNLMTINAPVYCREPAGDSNQMRIDHGETRCRRRIFNLVVLQRFAMFRQHERHHMHLNAIDGYDRTVCPAAQCVRSQTMS
jgi:hypothetical protein